MFQSPWCVVMSVGRRCAIGGPRFLLASVPIALAAACRARPNWGAGSCTGDAELMPAALGSLVDERAGLVGLKLVVNAVWALQDALFESLVCVLRGA